MLSAAGQGLGAVTGVTNIITNLREQFHHKRAQVQANSIMPSSEQELEDTKGEKMSYVTATGEMVYKGGSAWENIRKHMRALQLTKTHPHVTSAAKELMNVGQVSTRSSRQVQKAFGGTALAMTKPSLIKQGLGNAFFLGQDIYTLWEDWKDLKAETPTELAKELRMRAKEHEREVSEQTRRYRELKKRLQKRVVKSS